MADRIAVVTGAHGFIGRHVSRYFALQGWRVVGMGHGNWSPDEWKSWGMSAWYPCDITIENLLVYAENSDVILHCAGSGSVSFSIANPIEDHQRTVNTALAVLEFIRRYAPGTRLVYPSSAAVYGIASQFPICEDSPGEPVSMYGFNKKMAEGLCLFYAKYHQLAISVVRLFSVYGPGLRKQLLWDACSRININDTEFSGTGKESRDLLHIEDAVKLLMVASENASPKCPIVNGASGSESTVQEILREIFSAFSSNKLPKFSGAVRPGDPSRYWADISQARRWGWKPEISLRIGIRQYVEWFKETIV